jgi:transcriptional regulator with XRE-family HTH domain
MPRLFGEKLRRARIERQMTQMELGQKIGPVSHSHVAKLEASEDTPSLGLAVRAARILKVSIDYLLRDTIPVEDLTAPAAMSDADAQREPAFGARLRSLRLQRQLSQRDLTQQLHLASDSYISRLETGKGKLPSIDLVIHIADLFGVTIDDLLYNVVLDVSKLED